MTDSMKLHNPFLISIDTYYKTRIYSSRFFIYVSNVAHKRSQLKEALKFMPANEAKDLLNDIIESEDTILDILLKYLK